MSAYEQVRKMAKGLKNLDEVCLVHAEAQLIQGEKVEDVQRRLRAWNAEIAHEAQCDGRESLRAE